jgi:mono/diheme cytochrome c family protein
MNRVHGRIRTLVRWLAVAGASAAMFGCYSGLEGPYGTDPAAVARGEALADQYCGSCHGMGPSGQSDFPGAPAFRDMRFDYNAITYQRSLEHLHAGRVHMPPPQLTDVDVGDIGAYVRSLKRHAKP